MCRQVVSVSCTRSASGVAVHVEPMNRDLSPTTNDTILQYVTKAAFGDIPSEKNQIMFGPRGMFKSTALKNSLKAVEAFDANITTLYVGGSEVPSLDCALSDHVVKLGYASAKTASCAGSTNTIVPLVAGELAARGKRLVLAVDDADKLLEVGSGNKVQARDNLSTISTIEVLNRGHGPSPITVLLVGSSPLLSMGWFGDYQEELSDSIPQGQSMANFQACRWGRRDPLCMSDVDTDALAARILDPWCQSPKGHASLMRFLCGADAGRMVDIGDAVRALTLQYHKNIPAMAPFVHTAHARVYPDKGSVEAIVLGIAVKHFAQYNEAVLARGLSVGLLTATPWATKGVSRITILGECERAGVKRKTAEVALARLAASGWLHFYSPPEYSMLSGFGDDWMVRMTCMADMHFHHRALW